jgi:multiple sugar transport system permease protein
LINNIFALIFVYLGLALPFGTWTMKGYFDTIPISIDEASAIDGASRLRTLVSVLMPLVVPGLISMIILVFVSSWSQFIVPFILLSDSRLFPISVGLVNMQSTADTVSTQLLSAASVISILPTIAIFTFFQKYIVSAMTAGAVKG